RRQSPTRPRAPRAPRRCCGQSKETLGHRQRQASLERPIFRHWRSAPVISNACASTRPGMSELGRMLPSRNWMCGVQAHTECLESETRAYLEAAGLTADMETVEPTACTERPRHMESTDRAMIQVFTAAETTVYAAMGRSES